MLYPIFDMKSFFGKGLYGSNYYVRKFLEKPFFLGVDGISQDEDKNLSFNPLLLNVYADATWEQSVIYMFHVRKYSCYRINDLKPHFDRLQSILMIFLSKIADQKFSTGPFDDIMAAYNILTIMSEMMTYVLRLGAENHQKDPLVFNLELAKYIEGNLESEPTAAGVTNAKSLLASRLTGLIGHLGNILTLLNHNDLSVTSTEVVTNSDATKMHSLFSLEDFHDPFFTEVVRNISINDDQVEIQYFKNSVRINFDWLIEKIPDKIWDFPNNGPGGEILINENNVSFYYSIRSLLEKPESHVSHQKFTENMDSFSRSFNNRRAKLNERNEVVLLTAEEIQFVFSLMTESMKLLGKMPERNTKAGYMILSSLHHFVKILNALRYPELKLGTTFHSVLIFSKTLVELLSSPKVENFIQMLPGEIVLIAVKLTGVLAALKGVHCMIKKVEYDPMVYRISQVVDITSETTIPKIRRRTWKKALGDEASAENCLQFFGQKDCPICLAELECENFSLLICKHILCTSCTKTIVSMHQNPRCPICRTFFSEFLPSVKVTEICESLQDDKMDTDVHRCQCVFSKRK